MKKSSIILLLLSCTFFSVWAQKYEIALSEKEDFPGNTNSIQHIWTDSADNHYYSFIEVKDKLNFGGKPEEVVSTVLLKKYNPQFEWQHTMSVDYGKEDGDLFTFIHFGNKFYVVDRIEKEKELESTFRLRPFSSNKNAEAPIILLQKKYSNAAKVPKVHFWTSVDQSTYYSIAVVDQNSPTRSTELEINAFDHSLTNIRTQTFTLPIKEDQFKLISVFEDSKDAVWIIYSTPDTTRKTEKRVTYGMFKFLPNNPVQVQVPLDFQGNMLTSFRHAIDKNDHIHFVGVFEKDEAKATKNTSLVYLKLDPDGKPVSYAQKKFTAKEMDILGDENMYVGKDGDIGLSPEVLMKSLFVYEDGSVKLLMEYNSRERGGEMHTTRTRYESLSREQAEIMRNHDANRPKMKYEDSFESHDIVVVNINPSGMFEKPWRISKRQRFSGIDNNLSYSALLVGSKLYLMFNDNVSNLEEPVDTPDPATMERFRKNTVVLVTATQDGVIKKEEIPALSDGKFLITPMYTRRTGPASMAFYYERIRSAGTDYRLGHIRFVE